MSHDGSDKGHMTNVRFPIEKGPIPETLIARDDDGANVSYDLPRRAR